MAALVVREVLAAARAAFAKPYQPAAAQPPAFNTKYGDKGSTFTDDEIPF